MSEIQRVNLYGNDIVKVEANPSQGFNYPFFVFLPDTIDKNIKNYLYVESNNTGKSSDDFDVHLLKAAKLAKHSYANQIAKRLHVPLLIPTFPRPRANWKCYTHALDRDTLEIKEGLLKRIDLQLIAMIDYTQQFLLANGFQMYDRIFMHGFSASAKFCNRFAYLHPKRVQAVAAGGVNGLPTLPIGERNGFVLPFPIGIADIENITGQPFDEQSHQRVAQYIYMGSWDRNDTLPSRDAWSEEEAHIISKATSVKMMPDRWKLSQAVYRKHLPRAQCVTYNGIVHTIKDEMLNDIVNFFKANSGDSFNAIKPYTYPFVEYRELEKAHVSGLFCKGDKSLPEFVAKGLREGVFLIGIKEWVQGQNHRQLDEFASNAGFNFVLRAEDQPEIVISRDNYGGSSSTGNGKFQAFYVNLHESQLRSMAPEIPYTLHPQNHGERYKWMVNENLTLVKPIDYESW